MRKLFICFLLLSVSAKANAMRGVYLGVRGGQFNFKGVSPGTGLGLDAGLRLTKAFDVVGQLQTSSHGDAFSHWSAGAGGEMRIFRGMADLELSLGIGAGLYSMTTGGQTDLKPGMNLGVTLDFVIERSIHIGTMARYHVFSNGSYGSNMSVWMVRIGYYFSTAPETSLTIIK